MASLRDLQRTLFPTATLVGPDASSPAHVERADRDVHWVRILRTRVPAFEALDAGDLAIIPGPSLAVVAPDRQRIDELAAALAGAAVPAVLLVEGDAGSAALATLGEAAAERGVTTFALGRADPVALERRIIRALIDRSADGDGPAVPALPGSPTVGDEAQPAYRPAVERILRGLAALPEGPFDARELLAPILVGRHEAQRERLETLRAVLGSASIVEAALRLGVHRNTVAYRVARMEERSGWDLTDPDLRLALLIALTLVQDA